MCACSIPPPPPPHHFDDLGVGLLCQVAPADSHVVHQLVERGALVLLHLEVRQRVHKVKDSTALLQLLQEQLRLLRRWHVWAHKPNGHREKGKRWREKLEINADVRELQRQTTQSQRQWKENCDCDVTGLIPDQQIFIGLLF